MNNRRSLNKPSPGVSSNNSLEDALHNALKVINSFDYDGFDDQKRKIVAQFLNTRRSYAIPDFINTGNMSTDDRRKNLFGGHLFTSQRHQWPLTDGDGLPMQPVFQIDLRDASSALGLDLGDGLLQLWGRVDSSRDAVLSNDNYIDNLAILRKIPQEEVSEEVLSDFPSSAPWELSGSDIGDHDPQIAFVSAPEAMRVGSVVQWKQMGDMLRHQEKIDFQSDEDLYYLREALYLKLQGFFATPTSAPKLYLGGFGGQSGGGEDPTFYDDDSPLILRIDFGNGDIISIMANRIESNNTEFKWVYRYHG